MMFILAVLRREMGKMKTSCCLYRCLFLEVEMLRLGRLAAVIASKIT